MKTCRMRLTITVWAAKLRTLRGNLPHGLAVLVLLLLLRQLLDANASAGNSAYHSSKLRQQLGVL
jgi:hypothetical protein